MLPARTYSISIRRGWRDLYEEIWRPEMFPKWASGLSDSELHAAGEDWVAQGPEGPIRIRFTPHNAFGIMDHFVDTGQGDPVHIPMRVVQNGEAAEVMLTLYRQPGMDDEKFAADAKWINRDLVALKRLAEGR